MPGTSEPVRETISGRWRRERREVVSLSFRGSDSSELGQFTFRDSVEVDMVNEVDEDFFPEIKPITDLKKDYKLLGR